MELKGLYFTYEMQYSHQKHWIFKIITKNCIQKSKFQQLKKIIQHRPERQPINLYCVNNTSTPSKTAQTTFILALGNIAQKWSQNWKTRTVVDQRTKSRTRRSENTAFFGHIRSRSEKVNTVLGKIQNCSLRLGPPWPNSSAPFWPSLENEDTNTGEIRQR